MLSHEEEERVVRRVHPGIARFPAQTRVLDAAVLDGLSPSRCITTLRSRSGVGGQAEVSQFVDDEQRWAGVEAHGGGPASFDRGSVAACGEVGRAQRRPVADPHGRNVSVTPDSETLLRAREPLQSRAGETGTDFRCNANVRSGTIAQRPQHPGHRRRITPLEPRHLPLEVTGWVAGGTAFGESHKLPVCETAHRGCFRDWAAATVVGSGLFQGGERNSLRFEDDPFAVIKGKCEASECIETDERLIAKDCHCDANQDSNVVFKVREPYLPQEDWRHHL